MFHEIDQDSIDRVRGVDITVVTSAKTDEEGRAILKALGFPFKINQRLRCRSRPRYRGVGKPSTRKGSP